MPFPSLFGDIQHLALKVIGLSHHSQGSNTVEEDITVRTQVTDCSSAMLMSYFFFVVVVKLKAFIPSMKYAL